MRDQGRCEDFGGRGGGGRVDLPPELFQFTWFCDAHEPLSWLAQSKKFWNFEFSRPSEIAFLESFLPKISMFYYCLTMKISKITTDHAIWQCYLQFNVTRKIEKILEIRSLQIVRKGYFLLAEEWKRFSHTLLGDWVKVIRVTFLLASC
jgi:hypothetical protein